MARLLEMRASAPRISVELNEGFTADTLRGALPFESRAGLWRDELCFPASLAAAAEPGAREEVEVADVAYWPPGDAPCLFFGRTLASTGGRPRAASPVTVVGRISSGIGNCRRVSSGERLRVGRGS